MHEFSNILSTKNIHTSAYLIASKYCRLPVQIRGEFQLSKLLSLLWKCMGNCNFLQQKISNMHDFVHSLFDVHYTLSLIKQSRKNMGFPCKEKSHIFTLFANLCHQRMHQVLHSTLIGIITCCARRLTRWIPLLSERGECENLRRKLVLPGVNRSPQEEKTER